MVRAQGYHHIPPACHSGRELDHIQPCRQQPGDQAVRGLRIGNAHHRHDAGLAQTALQLSDVECCSAHFAMPPSAATRRALAAMVSAAFRAAEEGKDALSPTQRLSTSCALHEGFSTLLPGSWPITKVPHM